MGTAIGTSLPYAVAAALSPVPITAVVLILLGHRRLASSLFAGGRVFAYAFVTTIVIVASELARFGTDAAPSGAGVAVRIGLGVLALGAAAWSWLGRPSKDASTASRRSPAPTRWMQALGRISPARSAALGVALSSGPKNLVLVAAGGLTVAGARLTYAQEAVAAVIFLAIASSTVTVPVVLYYALGARMIGVLRSLEGWMETNSAAISTVLFILVGVFLIGSGIAGL